MSEPAAEKNPLKLFRRTRISALALCALALLCCLIFLWFTRDARVQLDILRKHRTAHNAQTGDKTVVSTAPWRTANALQALGSSTEEHELGRQAERLADHDVDQAFALALRLTGVRVRHNTLSGAAQDYAQIVASLEQTVKQDRQMIRQLGGDPDAKQSLANPSNGDNEDSQLDLARTQLSLDSGELEDARKTLAAISGDNSEIIERELANYQQEQQRALNLSHSDAQPATASTTRHTLLRRLQSWQKQSDRTQLIEQAAALAQSEQASLVQERAETQKKLVALLGAPAAAGAQPLNRLKDKTSSRQILSIYDDRIESCKQLAGVYNKWLAQLTLQRRILLHLIVTSLAWILFIVLCAIAADLLTQRLLQNPSLEPRQAHTLRTIVRLSLQFIAAIVILLIVFGFPQQTTTVLGMLTAALTIALQDFLLAFLGWFLLMGRNGAHAGDWVEINGVSGEVVDVGLLKTTLIELGGAAGKGHPTGRRISFLNSYAIRGKYFNFSTSVQWMWDEVSIGVPKTVDVRQVASEIEQIVREQTAENAEAAARDWRRVGRNSSLSRMDVAATVSMRPTAEGLEVTAHYITRAMDRLATRDKLYLQLLGLLQDKQQTR